MLANSPILDSNSVILIIAVISCVNFEYCKSDEKIDQVTAKIAISADVQPTIPDEVLM